MKTFVVGAGFLGQEIIKVFDDAKLFVLGSKRNNQNSLKNIVVLDVLRGETLSSIPSDINQIVYAVSAKSSDAISYEDAYYRGVNNVINYSKRYLKKDVKHVFISSTGVYKENSGGIVSESSQLEDNDLKYKYLIDAENSVLQSGGAVLRLSGIYGEGRSYLVKHAQNLTDFTVEDLKWTNRIHKSDAAKLCLKLVGENFKGIINVSDTLPSVNLDTLNFIRKNLGLDEIELDFNPEQVLLGKRCSSNHLKSVKFEFMYPSYIEGYSKMLQRV